MSRGGRKHAAARAAAVPLPPLTPFMRRIFFDEIFEQCHYVLLAAEQLQMATSALFATPGPLPIAPNLPAIGKLPAEAMVEMTAVWYAIQNLTVAAANISKLLWGNYEANTQEQRRPLRKLLAVTQTAPLKGRSLRNHLEHIDTRIISLFGDPTIRTQYVGRNVGWARAIKADAPRFSHYDPRAGLVTFWKDSVSIPAVVAEARRILPLADAGRHRPLE